MRDFEYRTPRFTASAAFHFQMGEICAPGLCTNVSSGGVSALIDELIPKVGSAGSVVLRYPQKQFTLGALVTHVEGCEVGFSFIQRNEEERTAAADFAAFLEAQSPIPIGRHTEQDPLLSTT